MDALPALEVIADTVIWDWDLSAAAGRHGRVADASTVASGFSHVSVRAPSLQLNFWNEDVFNGGFQIGDIPPEEALIAIVCHAPPTLRGCSLGLGAEQPAGWTQELRIQYSLDYSVQGVSVYKSAAELAVALHTCAAPASVDLQIEVNEQDQSVHLTRISAA